MKRRRSTLKLFSTHARAWVGCTTNQTKKEPKWLTKNQELSQRANRSRPTLPGAQRIQRADAGETLFAECLHLVKDTYECRGKLINNNQFAPPYDCLNAIPINILPSLFWRRFTPFQFESGECSRPQWCLGFFASNAYWQGCGDSGSWLGTEI